MQHAKAVKHAYRIIVHVYREVHMGRSPGMLQVVDQALFEIVDPGQCPVELFLRDDIEVEALTG